jgi:hypothetical protein
MQTLEHSILNSSDTIKSMYYSIDKKYVLWLENDIIKKGELILENNLIGINKTEVLISGYVSAFTLDSIQHLVYYFDRKGLQIIAFSVNDPQVFAIIISKTKENVGDMKIDPINHYLFWSEWDNTNSRACIMRSNQDGSDSIVLPIMADLSEPSVMTIDSRYEKLCFIDKSLYFMGCSDYFGNYTPVIPYNEENKDLLLKLFRFAHSLDIYRSTIYWSYYKYVCSIPENGDLHNLKLVMFAEHDVDCLTVFHHSRQPYSSINHCANNNCCGLCLPTRKNFKCAFNHTINTNNNSSCDVSFQTNKRCKKKILI